MVGNADCLFGGHSGKFNGIADGPDRCASCLFAYSNECTGMFLLNTIRHTDKHQLLLPLVIDVPTKLKLISLRQNCAG